MKTTPRKRLFIVDDHPIVRDGLRSIEQMDSRFSIVGTAGEAETALEQIRRLQPDVVLLDIRLPGRSGIELCRQLKAERPGLPVLLLTSYTDDHLVLAAMEAGADGYLLKDNDARKIVEALREVLRGAAAFDPSVSRTVLSRARRGPASVLERLAQLTEQEHRVLAEVATGKTDKEVAATLQLSPKTVRNYLSRVFEKLEVTTRTQAAMLYAQAAREPGFSDLP